MDANSAASSAGFSDAALTTSPHDIASEMTTTKRNLIEIMALTNPCALNSEERLNQGLIQRKDQLSEYARAATATTTRTSSGNACPCRITELGKPKLGVFRVLILVSPKRRTSAKRMT